MIARPRILPYLILLVIACVLWTAAVTYHHYHIWQTTGLEAPNMGSSIRNGILVAAGIALVAYGASFAWLHRTPANDAGHPAGDNAAVAASTSGTSASPGAAQSMLAQHGQQFVLEVRGLGVVTGRDNNEEIWQAIEAKADNNVSYLSQNPADYPGDADTRVSNLGLVKGLAFDEAAKHAVERWPVPVFVWGPPKDPKNSYRAAVDISDARQKAGLGATLFLWQDDANSDDGAAIVKKLFDFFDTHPDAPSALVFSIDGTLTRALLGAPGHVELARGHVIPAQPDSIVAMLVSRSDRVDRLIRPFAVSATDQHGTDDDKLWDYYWSRNDGEGPDGFEAFYRSQIQDKGYDHPMIPGTMSSAWWQQQLPSFWKEIANKGPGQFAPSPYLPIRWTTSQVKNFEQAPMLGYLHRPVLVKLTDDEGHPLKTASAADALKLGWEQALATLPANEQPRRVFYDTTGDRQWVIPLHQALAQAGKPVLDLSDAKEGYDIGRRIGDTGISSPLVQIGLGLISGFEQGGASATISRSPNGTVSIVMVSPPDPATRAAVVASQGKAPFSGQEH
jgi:hypothetical protein